MDEELLLVGTDACVLIEAARLRDEHPSRLLMKPACAGAFRLLLVEQAEREARLAVGDELDSVLEGCHIRRCPNPPDVEIEAAYPAICPRMKHGNDVPLAVAVRNARPDYFVSSNPDHWKPSLSEILCGVPIMSPRRFRAELGVPAPPRPAPRRRAVSRKP